MDETSTPDSVWGSVELKQSLNRDLVQRAQDGKLNERDLDIALSLTTFVHNEYQEFGTSSRNVLDDQDIAVAQRAVVVVLSRLGVLTTEIEYARRVCWT